ncbi:MAG TPA: hypothetical protein VIF85_06795 [Gaiellaceae bacterium]
MAAIALVLLVRGVSGVLAAVVAAELLAFRGLAPAPHVLAVHACLPFQSGSLQIVPRLSCTLYASRALCQPGEDLVIGSRLESGRVHQGDR